MSRPTLIALSAALGAAAVFVLLGDVGGSGVGRPAPAQAAVTVTTVHHSSPTVTRPPAPPTTRPPIVVPVTRPARVPVRSPTTHRPARTLPFTFPTRPPVTTAAPTTTIAPIGGRLPVPPSTLPLVTHSQSAHVSPVFAALSGAGFFVALCIVAVRWILTRPGRVGS